MVGCLHLGFPGFNVPFSLQGVPVIGKYVKRDREMQEMEQKLHPTQINKGRDILIVHGLGGIGKTQLSLAFARKHQDKYSAVFWLDGQTRSSLRECIMGIAKRLPKAEFSFPLENSNLQENELDTIIKEVKAWFEEAGNNKWLILYDNVDRDNSSLVNDPDAFDIEEFLPQTDQGSIIITTRLFKLRNLGEELKVTAMKAEESLEVLSSRLNQELTGKSFLKPYG